MSREAAGRPMSSDASDTSLCTPQVPGCPARQQNINVESLIKSSTQILVKWYTVEVLFTPARRSKTQKVIM